MPESIFQRISEGDKAAVRECISRYGGLVWAMARRFATERADAEDAVQEIFIELWTHARRYDPSVASETTFVAMIARRKLIDRRRKLFRRPTSDDLPDEFPGSIIDPPDQAIHQEEAGRAAFALQALAEPAKTILTLSIYQGLTYDAIARRLRLPLGTVKTHARRGLIQLRRELGADTPEPALSREGDHP